jgi:transposase
MPPARAPDFVVEIVRRLDAEPGFKVLPRRWLVERTFGWMTRWRRLVRDYEARVDVAGDDPCRDGQPAAQTNLALNAFSNGLAEISQI